MTYNASRSLIINVLRANAPQFAISLVYVFYNNVFTCMVGQHEYAKFASVRKALRVSKPEGKQRSTFWLQLPYRYVLPLMAAMAILHWLIARSIFVVQIRVYDLDHSFMPDKSVNACGYSTIALIFAVGLGGIMILTLVGFAFRRLDPGMPVAVSCSVILSGAAQAGAAEKDAAFQPPMYGVVLQPQAHGQQIQRAGFSSKEVRPLMDGVIYS